MRPTVARASPPGLPRDGLDGLDEGGGGHQRVPPVGHGTAGVGLLAGDGDVEPLLRQRVRDDADVEPLALEDGALLDVDLEIGLELAEGRGFGLARPADGCQRVAEARALGVARVEHLVLREGAHGGAASHHRRREAGALLVGPVDEEERRLGLGAGLVQRAHHLEPGENAEHAVELAARGLRVEVTADGDGPARRVPSRPAQRHVAEAVGGERKPDLRAPAREQRPSLPVERGQRLAVAAALGRGADPRHFHQRVPEPRAGEGDVGHAARSTPHHSAISSAMLRVIACMEASDTLSSMPWISCASGPKQATGVSW